MQRPALTTLVCINADCQHVGRSGQGNFAIPKVYGKEMGLDQGIGHFRPPRQLPHALIR
jgi:hypothetical protein